MTTSLLHSRGKLVPVVVLLDGRPSARSVDGDLSWTSRGRPSGASEWRG